AGANDFISKPFDSVILSARIRNSIRTKVLQDQILEYQGQLEQQNLSLEQRVRERTSQVETIQHVTVFSLAKIAESRDPETGDHLERMRAYVREVALQLRTDAPYSDQLD